MYSNRLQRILHKDFPPFPIFFSKDCEYCAEDINKAIADCDDIPPDDQHALYRCIEDGLIAAADCIVCICEMMGIIAGVDIEPCH